MNKAFKKNQNSFQYNWHLSFSLNSPLFLSELSRTLSLSLSLESCLIKYLILLFIFFRPLSLSKLTYFSPCSSQSSLNLKSIENVGNGGNELRRFSDRFIHWSMPSHLQKFPQTLQVSLITFHFYLLSLSNCLIIYSSAAFCSLSTIIN